MGSTVRYMALQWKPFHFQFVHLKISAANTLLAVASGIIGWLSSRGTHTQSERERENLITNIGVANAIYTCSPLVLIWPYAEKKGNNNMHGPKPVIQLSRPSHYVTLHTQNSPFSYLA